MNVKRNIGGRTEFEEASLTRQLYFSDHYFSADQFSSLCSQLRTVHKYKPSTVLEIGIGNGFVSNFLRDAGYSVTTLDINPDLKPDVVGSILNLATLFEPNNFDLILCAEVLEHMPWEDAQTAIKLMSTVATKNVVITLPRSQKIILDFQFALKIPKTSKWETGIFLSTPRRAENIPNHHWELDSRDDTTLEIVKKIISKHYRILTVQRERTNPYHYFFELQIPVLST